ncbi:MAG TPA: hypothetical protein DIT25_00205 [Candidatus Moranbacteria bacterium]|nr:hypothetical protein [Candidatus Moranbacteria bacterium]
MAKRKTHEVAFKERRAIIENFFEILSGLKSKNEVTDFLVGLLTPSEVLMISRRIQIAQLLLENVNYEEICRRLRVGSQMVTKTDRWLHGGGDENFIWLQRCLKAKQSLKKSNRSGLDKYPQHRIWKELFS